MSDARAQQIPLSGLWYRCRDFVTEQSAGEWDDKTIAEDANKLFTFISEEIARVAAPDMLAALDGGYRALCHVKFNDDHFPELAEAKKYMRAAIARATGDAS